MSNQRECNHMLCTLSLSPAKDAVNIVTQNWDTDAGTKCSRDTYTCVQHTEDMRAILGPNDTVRPYLEGATA